MVIRETLLCNLQRNNLKMLRDKLHDFVARITAPLVVELDPDGVPFNLIFIKMNT